MFRFAKMLLPKKLLKRIATVSTSDLLEVIPEKCLKKEWGGTLDTTSVHLRLKEVSEKWTLEKKSGAPSIINAPVSVTKPCDTTLDRNLNPSTSSLSGSGDGEIISTHPDNEKETKTPNVSSSGENPTSSSGKKKKKKKKRHH